MARAGRLLELIGLALILAVCGPGLGAADVPVVASDDEVRFALKTRNGILLSPLTLDLDWPHGSITVSAGSAVDAGIVLWVLVPDDVSLPTRVIPRVANAQGAAFAIPALGDSKTWTLDDKVTISIKTMDNAEPLVVLAKPLPSESAPPSGALSESSRQPLSGALTDAPAAASNDVHPPVDGRDGRMPVATQRALRVLRAAPANTIAFLDPDMVRAMQVAAATGSAEALSLLAGLYGFSFGVMARDETIAPSGVLAHALIARHYGPTALPYLFAQLILADDPLVRERLAYSITTIADAAERSRWRGIFVIDPRGPRRDLHRLLDQATFNLEPDILPVLHIDLQPEHPPGR